MSLLPYLLREDPFQWALADPFRYHHSCFDNDFGTLIHPKILNQILETPSLLRQNISKLQQDLGTIETINKDGNFQINVDVQNFKPNEISVKVVEDGQLIIEGKHEERNDECGAISRQFIRSWTLPTELIDINQVQTTLSSDGLLTITAPKLMQAIESKERVVPITQTGPAKDNIKPNTECENQ